MKLHCVLTCCLAIAPLSSNVTDASTTSVAAESGRRSAVKRARRFALNQTARSVLYLSFLVLRINKLALVTKCPTKEECKEVPPAFCNGNRDCTCTPLPLSQCKPICRNVDKEVYTQPDCYPKGNCHEPCFDKDCNIECDKVCPPKKCSIVTEQICETPSCEKCVSCQQVPNCSVGCGDGYCDGTAGERCQDDRARTCPERFVPRCVPARPLRSKTPDDERKKKKKKGQSSGSDSDSDSSDGSDSDSDSSKGYDSDSDSRGCGSDSDSDDCYRKCHH